MTPQLTTDWTLAMKRCADLLDWTVETEGRTWVVVDPIHDTDLGPFRGSARLVLAHMVTAALSTGGYGMDPAVVRDAIALELPRDPRTGYVIWPSACYATEIAALAPLYRE